MSEKDLIYQRISLLKPKHLLDIGCGCGGFTASLAPYCDKITAIEIEEGLVNTCKKKHQRENITYLCMDGRNLDYSADTFDVVMERGSLHHLIEWQLVLDEMIRVGSEYILIGEPVDDPRSEEKRNAIYGQEFLNKIQLEIGYPHYKHLEPSVLMEYLEKRNISVEAKTLKIDEIISFDEFAGYYYDFANRIDRKDYFLTRLEDLRNELKDKKFCQSDVVYIFGKKNPGNERACKINP